MKRFILMLAASFAALALSGQNFVLNYNQVVVEANGEMSSSPAAGTITLSKSMVKYSSGHFDDLYYLGSVDVNHQPVGLYTVHTWSRPESIGAVYLRLIVIDGVAREASIKQTNGVIRSGNKIVRADCVLHYIDSKRPLLSVKN